MRQDFLKTHVYMVIKKKTTLLNEIGGVIVHPTDVIQQWRKTCSIAATRKFTGSSKSIRAHESKLDWQLHFSYFFKLKLKKKRNHFVLLLKLLIGPRRCGWLRWPRGCVTVVHTLSSPLWWLTGKLKGTRFPSAGYFRQGCGNKFDCFTFWCHLVV